MSKRDGYDSTDTQEMETLPAATSAAAGSAPAVPRKSDEEKVSLFWRLFGGAVISMACLGGFTLYNTLTSSIAELRAENSRLKEDAAALRTRADDNRREIDSMKERLSKYRLEMDAAKKDAGTATDGVKREVTAVEKELQKALAEVREKLARLEGRQTPMKPTDDK
jgi:regulator of replication initiation timing